MVFMRERMVVARNKKKLDFREFVRNTLAAIVVSSGEAEIIVGDAEVCTTWLLNKIDSV